MKSKLVIIDLSNFIFRAFYAIRPDLRSPQGVPVNAIRGVYSMLLKLLADQKPTHVLVACDRKEDSFRKELFPNYKANRDAPPADLVPQFGLIQEMVDKLAIQKISVDRYEADDVIASAVCQWQDFFDEILVASSDKDLMQFVNDRVRLIDTMKNLILGPEQVFEKMGVHPHQIVDYLSMVGDSSDNIPGMKGIGAKGASKLLLQYGSLDNIIKSKSELKDKKSQQAFEVYLEDGLLSRKLIVLETKLDLKISASEAIFELKPSEDLFAFLKNLGFNQALKQLEELAKKQTTTTPAAPVEKVTREKNSEHILIQSDSEFKNFLKELKNIQTFSLFIAYDQEDIFVARPLRAGVCLTGEMVYLINFTTLSPTALEEFWNATYGSKDKTIVGHDLKRDLKYACLQKLCAEALCYDVLVAHYVIDVSAKHELSYITDRYLGHEIKAPVHGGESLGLDSSGDELELQEELARGLFQLKRIMDAETERLDVHDILYKVDLPLIHVLANMECRGVSINVPFLKKLSVDYTEELKGIEQKIEEVTGEKINLKSPKQVSFLLFEKLKLPEMRKTKTGLSTDVSVLEDLDALGLSEVPRLILRYRELEKLLSTYINVIPNLIHPKTHKLHSTFNQYVTATGRLSSDGPNLQNIPVRSSYGKMIRKAFIADSGKILLAADYSQVELRLLAHFGQDPTMLKAFRENKDIHAQTASQVQGIPLEQVTKDERSKAKAVNFGLMYGQSSFGLSQSLKISRNEARDYIQSYFEHFGRIKAYLDGLKELCEEKGYTETYLGRKRYLPDIRSSNRTVKSVAERLAVNTPIQGTAADMIKVAMIHVDQEIKNKSLKSHMILQVHDELIFEVPEDEVPVMEEIVKRNMENALKLSIPLVVDVGVGVNWFDLK